MQVIESKEEAEVNALSLKEDGPTIIGATAAKSMAGGEPPPSRDARF